MIPCSQNTLKKKLKINQKKSNKFNTFTQNLDIYRYNVYVTPNIMGRKVKTIEEKKDKISVSISKENYEAMTSEGINKSKLINWLLEQHFNSLNNGK